MTKTLGADHRHLVHTIELTPDSPLRRVVAGDQMKISCYHHQGISRPGAGLVASAHASDGTIEAVSLAGHDGWYLGVQWHPEDTAESDLQQAGIFRAFVHAAGQP
jgi:putative glutamine amidotransferase